VENKTQTDAQPDGVPLFPDSPEFVESKVTNSTFTHPPVKVFEGGRDSSVGAGVPPDHVKDLEKNDLEPDKADEDYPETLTPDSMGPEQPSYHPGDVVYSKLANVNGVVEAVDQTGGGAIYRVKLLGASGQKMGYRICVAADLELRRKSGYKGGNIHQPRKQGLALSDVERVRKQVAMLRRVTKVQAYTDSHDELASTVQATLDGWLTTVALPDESKPVVESAAQAINDARLQWGQSDWDGMIGKMDALAGYMAELVNNFDKPPKLNRAKAADIRISKKARRLMEKIASAGSRGADQVMDLKTARINKGDLKPSPVPSWVAAWKQLYNLGFLAASGVIGAYDVPRVRLSPKGQEYLRANKSVSADLGEDPLASDVPSMQQVVKAIVAVKEGLDTQDARTLRATLDTAKSLLDAIAAQSEGNALRTMNMMGSIMDTCSSLLARQVSPLINSRYGAGSGKARNSIFNRLSQAAFLGHMMTRRMAVRSTSVIARKHGLQPHSARKLWQRLTGD